MFSAESNAPLWPEQPPGTEQALVMFAISAFPPDYAGFWVVRRLYVLPDGSQRADAVPRLATYLEQAREMIPPGLYRQERWAGDEDPHLLEVWF